MANLIQNIPKQTTYKTNAQHHSNKPLQKENRARLLNSHWVNTNQSK